MSVFPLEIFDIILSFADVLTLTKCRNVSSEFKRLVDWISFLPQKSLPFLSLWYYLVCYNNGNQSNNNLSKNNRRITSSRSALQIDVNAKYITLRMKGYCKVYGPTKRQTFVSVKYLLIENCLYFLLFPPDWYDKREYFPIFKITHTSYQDCQRKTIVKNFDIFTHRHTWKSDLINHHYGKELIKLGKTIKQMKPLFCFNSKIYRFVEKSSLVTIDPLSGNEQNINSVELPSDFSLTNFLCDQSCDRIGLPNLICIQNKETLFFLKFISCGEITIYSRDKIIETKEKQQIPPEFWFLGNIGYDLLNNYFTLEQ